MFGGPLEKKANFPRNILVLKNPFSWNEGGIRGRKANGGKTPLFENSSPKGGL